MCSPHSRYPHSANYHYQKLCVPELILPFPPHLLSHQLSRKMLFCVSGDWFFCCYWIYVFPLFLVSSCKFLLGWSFQSLEVTSKQMNKLNKSASTKWSEVTEHKWLPNSPDSSASQTKAASAPQHFLCKQHRRHLNVKENPGDPHICRNGRSTGLQHAYLERPIVQCWPMPQFRKVELLFFRRTRGICVCHRSEGDRPPLFAEGCLRTGT